MLLNSSAVTIVTVLIGLISGQNVYPFGNGFRAPGPPFGRAVAQAPSSTNNSRRPGQFGNGYRAPFASGAVQTAASNNDFQSPGNQRSVPNFSSNGGNGNVGRNTQGNNQGAFSALNANSRAGNFPFSPNFNQNRRNDVPGLSTLGNRASSTTNGNSGANIPSGSAAPSNQRYQSFFPSQQNQNFNPLASKPSLMGNQKELNGFVQPQGNTRYQLPPDILSALANMFKQPSNNNAAVSNPQRNLSNSNNGPTSSYPRDVRKQPTYNIRNPFMNSNGPAQANPNTIRNQPRFEVPNSLLGFNQGIIRSEDKKKLQNEQMSSSESPDSKFEESPTVVIGASTEEAEDSSHDGIFLDMLSGLDLNGVFKTSINEDVTVQTVAETRPISNSNVDESTDIASLENIITTDLIETMSERNVATTEISQTTQDVHFTTIRDSIYVTEPSNERSVEMYATSPEVLKQNQTTTLVSKRKKKRKGRNHNSKTSPKPPPEPTTQTILATSEEQKTTEQSTDDELSTFTDEEVTAAKIYSAITKSFPSNPDLISFADEIAIDRSVIDSAKRMSTSEQSTVTKSLPDEATAVTLNFDSKSILATNSGFSTKDEIDTTNIIIDAAFQNSEDTLNADETTDILTPKSNTADITTGTTLQNAEDTMNADETTEISTLKTESTFLMPKSSYKPNIESSTSIIGILKNKSRMESSSESNFNEMMSISDEITNKESTTIPITQTMSCISETSEIVETPKNEKTTVAVNSDTVTVKTTSTVFETENITEEIITPYKKYSPNEIKSVINSLLHDPSLKPYLNLLCTNFEESKQDVTEDKLTRNNHPATTVENTEDTEKQKDFTTMPTEVETASSATNIVLISAPTSSASKDDESNTITEVTESSTGTETTLGETIFDDTSDTKEHEKCGEDEEWWECVPLYHNTCDNFARASARQDLECNPGCFCADGLIKTNDGECVEPDYCPDPVCKNNEEATDCLNVCNTCEANCGQCNLLMCEPGCDCKDGFKRNKNGTCIHASECPPCTLEDSASSSVTDFVENPFSEDRTPTTISAEATKVTLPEEVTKGLISSVAASLNSVTTVEFVE